MDINELPEFLYLGDDKEDVDESIQDEVVTETEDSDIEHDGQPDDIKENEDFAQDGDVATPIDEIEIEVEDKPEVNGDELPEKPEIASDDEVVN